MVHDVSLSAIDLNLLVVLRALLEERHVTRAAQKLGLSQSATSHALSRLRELCADPLLVRHGATLALTPRATQLLPGLQRGLAELASVVTEEPAFEPRTARRRFTLALADYQQGVLLTPLLHEIEHAAPNIDLSVVSAPDLLSLLEAGSADLAIIRAGQDAPTFRTQKVFSDQFVCMVRRGHPRIKKKLSLDGYLSHRHVLVAPGGSPGSIVDTELQRRGLERRVALTVSSFLVVPVVVSDTDFISTLPERLARRMEKRFPIQLFEPPLRLPSFQFSLAWHPRLDRDRAHDWLRQVVVRVCAGL